MTLTSRRRILWLALAAAGCLAVVLLQARPEQRPPPPDLLIAGQPQTTNGAMLITIILSNGTPNTLDITDDGVGLPFVGFDDGTGTGYRGVDLYDFDASSLKLNLAHGNALTNFTPGAGLTNFAPGTALTIPLRLTHTPPRFQLVVRTLDEAWIRRRLPMEVLKYWTAKATFRRPTPPNYTLWARSPWITNSGTSNLTRTAVGQPKQTPTNGLSQ